MSKKPKQSFPITDPVVKEKLAEYCDSEYKLFGGFLHNHWVTNHEDKRQITQETFCQLTEFVGALCQQGSDVALEFLKDKEHVQGWLFTAAGYLSCNHHRRAALSGKYLAALEEKLVAFDAMIEQELRSNVRHAADLDEVLTHASKCSSRDQEIIKLRLEGHTLKEVADRVGLVAATSVWVRLGKFAKRVQAAQQRDPAWKCR